MFIPKEYAVIIFKQNQTPGVRPQRLEEQWTEWHRAAELRFRRDARYIRYFCMIVGALVENEEWVDTWAEVVDIVRECELEEGRRWEIVA